MQDIPREHLLQALREGLRLEVELSRDDDFDPTAFVRVFVRLTFGGEHVAQSAFLARLPTASEDAP